ncbi:unnamed protein product [Rhizophagus irregularis]|uniref:Uncharacterized protein n=1 Tax=Rhizophagus irregularis TaxID=588596 RepID=A0A916DYI1_9GLOM|nr:unnamed protein product [Rhizophagus irregularis]CAB5192938.1 unnamed protein product [Rhizophagus irregularis]CAB5305762.1 unnamed protein product [Rhizophagus irregularis]
MKSAYLMYVIQGIDENNKMEKWNKLTTEVGRSNKGKTPAVVTKYQKMYTMIIEMRGYLKLLGDFEMFKEENLDSIIEIDNRFEILRKIFIKGK